MRTADDIISEYKSLSTPNEKYILKTYQNEDGSTVDVYVAENNDKREKLREEYVKTLPENKKLAIFLHDTTCNLDHNEVCSWMWELEDGIVDQWDRFSHAEFLEKANVMLSESDFETIKNNLISPEKPTTKCKRIINRIFRRK